MHPAPPPSPFFLLFVRLLTCQNKKHIPLQLIQLNFSRKKNTKNDRERASKSRGRGMESISTKNNSFFNMNSNRAKNYDSNKKKHFKAKTNPLELKYHKTVAVTYQKLDSFLSSPYVHLEKTCGARCGVLLNSFFCKQTLERRTFENIGCVSKNKPRCAVRGVVA